LLDAPARARLAALAARLDDAAVRRIADSALENGCMPQMMELVRCMSTAQQKRVAALLEPLLADATGSTRAGS
ncbi:MAG TPA: hypothetical protein VNX47_14010, partial [Nevskia sp.]|nr:hypothetical protein [Nevskia sp.]